MELRENKIAAILLLLVQSLIFARLKTKQVATKFSKETYLYWYELMLLIRQFELKAEEKYKMEGKIRGFFHAYVGQEAIAAGCMTATKSEDAFITAYRDHGLALAKGISARSCMAELYGKATGCAKGKGGSMHFFGKKERFFGGHGIVGAQIGTGAGIAFAEKYKGTDAVCLTFFGDGAARQGMLHETFNLAMLWKLPVIFICENNNYAMGTSVERTSNVVDIYKLADAYEMPADSIDGMSPEAVHESISRAVKRAREGDGPTLIEIKTYRYKGHSISDPQKYRTKEEVEEYKQRDPIEQVLATILENNFATQEEIDAINKRVDAEVEESVKFAEESPWPDDSEVLKDIYVDENYPFIVD
nr:pyruvate dehydrogenase (acetyl-transferring) E1 component subunit alpha [Flavihumibacter stibioxidans]